MDLKVLPWRLLEDTLGSDRHGECCSAELNGFKTELKCIHKLCICEFINYLIIYYNYRNTKACKVNAK